MRNLFIVLLSLLGCLSGEMSAQGAWRFLPDTVRTARQDTTLRRQGAERLPAKAEEFLQKTKADSLPVPDKAGSVQRAAEIEQAGQLPLASDTVTTVTSPSASLAGAADSTVSVIMPDSTVQAVLAAGDSAGVPKVKLPSAFKPNPTKAVLLALVPGMGQIYNRKYWKLPIVYGAFMGCLYAVTWNNKSYQDYSEAYKDFMYDTANKIPQESWHQSWQDVTNRDPETVFNDTNFADQLKRRKDYYRRYRDLSIIITVGVYALSIVDAYVDAQLFDFDITPDLSLRVEPVVTPKTTYSSSTYGLNCSIKF